jgi:hypothetical protein
MNRIIIITYCLLTYYCTYSQDWLFYKNTNVSKVKILEINVDKIKFQKISLPRGPSFEILKSDIWKIKYRNGMEEILDTAFANNLKIQMKKALADTSKYSIIYISGNPFVNEYLSFPLFFNNQYIGTINRNSRIVYKIFSSGLLTISRSAKLNEKVVSELNITSGKKYGVLIDMPQPHSYNIEKKYRIDLAIEEQDINSFLENYFINFKADENNDLEIKEDINSLIIK